MKLLNATQLAKLVGVSRATIHRWVSDGRIKPSATAGRHPVWTESDVHRVKQWVQDNYRPDKAKGGRE
jgi:excisionase family DNA binding protein